MKLIKKRNILIGIMSICALLLISFLIRKNKTEEVSTEKTPFYITTQSFSATSHSGATLQKRGKIKGSSEITVTAQIGGRVVGLHKGMGDTVMQGEEVVQLQETSGIYSFGSQKASVAITQAQLTYEQTMLNLEKAIQDTKFGIEQASNQANNASLNNDVSAATLQLQSAKESFERAKLDYETKLLADDQTKENFGHTASNLVNDVRLLYESAIIEADKLLGVSTLRQTNNDLFENMLGARNTATKFAAEDAIRQALIYQTQLESFTITPESTQLADQLQQLMGYIQKLQPMLDAIDTMLEYTITGPTYSETQLAIHQATIDGLQAQTQGQITAITAQINAIQSFLRTYKETQASLAKAVDLSEQSYKTAQANLETVQNNTELQVNSLQNTLDTTEKNKETTEKTLKNSIKQAQIAYNEVGFQLSKLRADSSIDGTITDIFVDEGQDVALGTPLFRVVSDLQEIEVNLTASDLDYVEIGQTVDIQDDEGNTGSGTIVSVSTVGDQQGNFKAIVQIADSDDIILKSGIYANVYIHLATNVSSIPLSVVKIVDNNLGEVFLWDGATIQKKTVVLGNILGAFVEITSPLPAGTQLIISNIDSYDPKTMTITVDKERLLDKRQKENSNNDV